jgi:hypothetical protein
MQRMTWMTLLCFGLILFLAFGTGNSLHAQPARRGGASWKHQESLAQEQLAGIRRFLDRRRDEVVAQRSAHWRRMLTSPEAYAASVDANRARLRRLVGLVDEREAVTMEYYGTDANPVLVAETALYTVHQVRWPVFANIQGEGLLLTPKSSARARVVALPDADQTPEQIVGLSPGVAPASQFARRFTIISGTRRSAGCRSRQCCRTRACAGYSTSRRGRATRS